MNDHRTSSHRTYAEVGETFPTGIAMLFCALFGFIVTAQTAESSKLAALVPGLVTAVIVAGFLWRLHAMETATERLYRKIAKKMSRELGRVVTPVHIHAAQSSDDHFADFEVDGVTVRVVAENNVDVYARTVAPEDAI